MVHQCNNERNRGVTRRCWDGLRFASPLLAACLASIVLLPRTASAAPQPLDVILILDTTATTSNLLSAWKTSIQSQFIAPLQSSFPGSRFALVTHRDFPILPYGDPYCPGGPDWAFRLEAPLNADTTTLMQKLNALSKGCGADDAESQYTAITLSLTGEGIDLDGTPPLEYDDLGDVPPSNMGLSGNRVVLYHFTYPLTFHDRDVEPTYPVTTTTVPGKGAAFTAVHAHSVIYFALEPVVTTGAAPATRSAQTGQSMAAASASASNPADELATATGGAVLAVGTDLSGLPTSMSQSISIIQRSAPAATPASIAVMACALGSIALLLLHTTRKVAK